MEDTEPDTEPLSAADWLGARRLLAVELAAVAAAGAALFALAPRVEAAVLDARIVYLGVFSLFSVIFLRGTLRMLELLDWDCPRCHENYCGPLLFRTRCHGCGRAAEAEAPRSSPRGR